jgi:hypothetical protein
MSFDEKKSPGELKAICASMQDASNRFYSLAIQTGCHPFIEITGFLNEYIKVCSQAADQGIDFTNANTHTGGALPLQSYEAAYLGEKFGCMFETSLGRDPEMLMTFLLSAFDEKTVGAMASRFFKTRDGSAERMRTALTKIVEGLESEDDEDFISRVYDIANEGLGD